MSVVEVLKFGSSVLRSEADLPIAVDEIYRRWRAGSHILVVVSAFEGVTDRLLGEVSGVVDFDCREATAAYVSTGEQKTAALLLGSLRRSGMPSRIVEPREIGLIAEGSILESAPFSVDVSALRRLWVNHPILVLPGFYGIDVNGTTALFGRGGSDLSALFLAAELGGKCRLIKDVPGVFNSDPARLTTARRFAALSWATATEVAGPLIQPKALSFAESRELAFDVGRPNESAGTFSRKVWSSRSGPTPCSRSAAPYAKAGDDFNKHRHSDLYHAPRDVQPIIHRSFLKELLQQEFQGISSGKVVYALHGGKTEPNAQEFPLGHALRHLLFVQLRPEGVPLHCHFNGRLQFVFLKGLQNESVVLGLLRRSTVRNRAD